MSNVKQVSAKLKNTIKMAIKTSLNNKVNTNRQITYFLDRPPQIYKQSQKRRQRLKT